VVGRFVPAGATHRPGRLLGSPVATLAAGGEHVSDLDILRASWPFRPSAVERHDVTVFRTNCGEPGAVQLRPQDTSPANCGPGPGPRPGERNPALSATAADPLHSCRRGSTIRAGRWPGRKSRSAATARGRRGSSSGICTANDNKNSQPALDRHGNERTDAWVINATDVIGLQDYPPGTKLFLHAEPLYLARSRPCWTGRTAPGPGPVREPDQNPEKHRFGKTATPKPGTSNAGATALRDRRENHHPRPQTPAAAASHSHGKDLISQLLETVSRLTITYREPAPT